MARIKFSIYLCGGGQVMRHPSYGYFITSLSPQNAPPLGVYHLIEEGSDRHKSLISLDLQLLPPHCELINRGDKAGQKNHRGENTSEMKWGG
jgi:hypothetical protein